MKRLSLLLVLVSVAYLSAGCTPSYQPREEQQSTATKAAEINTQLGIIFMQQGKRDLALKKLKQALRQDSGLPSAHEAIAILYQELGETRKAGEHYEEAARLDPKDPIIQNNYGAFLCSQNKVKQAERHFMIAIKNPLYKTPQDAYTNAGLCMLRIPDRNKAEGYFRKALQVDPKAPIALREMARFNYHAAHYLNARAYLQRYMAVAPQTPDTLWLGIRIERKLGDQN
ncbi:MAG: type IV pilus biogenesis/stability protein PilW, partial [Gammaproteobacteria bacterium]|nr:type IV pilus biogenesis/stability protein PilW [Gammaproteobacteria bacterium]